MSRRPGGSGAASSAAAAAAPALAIEAGKPTTIQAYFNTVLQRKYRARQPTLSYISPLSNAALLHPLARLDVASGELKVFWLDMTRQELKYFKDLHAANAEDPLLIGAAWALAYAYVHYFVASYLHDQFKSRRQQIDPNAEASQMANINNTIVEDSMSLTTERGGEEQQIAEILRSYPAIANMFGFTTTTNAAALEPVLNIEDARRYVLKSNARKDFLDAGLPDLGEIGTELPIEKPRMASISYNNPLLKKRSRAIARNAAMIEAATAPRRVEEAAAWLYNQAQAVVQATPGLISRAIEAASPRARYLRNILGSVVSRGYSAASGLVGRYPLAAAPAAAPMRNLPITTAASTQVVDPLLSTVGPAAAKRPLNNKKERGAKRTRRNNNFLNEKNIGYEGEGEGGGYRRRRRRNRQTRRSHRKSKATRRR
jgi:hypothetical protein